MVNRIQHSMHVKNFKSRNLRCFLSDPPAIVAVYTVVGWKSTSVLLF